MMTPSRLFPNCSRLSSQCSILASLALLLLVHPLDVQGGPVEPSDAQGDPVELSDAQPKNCTPEENKDMQTQFTECTGRMTTEYHKKAETKDKEESTCDLFDSLINDCGTIWEQCHSVQDIRRMKDMQLEALLGQYSQLVTLDNCPLVQDWDGQEEPEGSGSGSCSDRQYIQTQTKFQTCSHSISSDIYQKFQDISDPMEISKQVCSALINISTSCPDLLKECFTVGDVKQMVRLHLQEIKGYLIALSSVKVDNASIDSCPPLVRKPGDEDLQYYEYEEEYEEEVDEKEGVVEQVHKTELLQEILSGHKQEHPADQPAEDTPPPAEERPTPTPAPKKKSSEPPAKSSQTSQKQTSGQLTKQTNKQTNSPEPETRSSAVPNTREPLLLLLTAVLCFFYSARH